MKLGQADLRLSPLLLLPTLVSAAVTLDCPNIRADKVSWDLSKLDGTHVISHIEKDWKQHITRNSTFSINICGALTRHKGVARDEECESGTRICNYAQYLDDGVLVPDLSGAYPIAGDYPMNNGRKLSPSIVRLKGSDSSADANTEGLRITLNGGMHAKTPQKAIIELVCDPKRDGLENDQSDNRPPAEGDDKEGNSKVKREEQARSLQVVEYKDVEDNDKKTVGVLRLKWLTKYACEDVKRGDDDNGGEKSSHWGFFTWFIIILFLAIAAYLIFGSWLNYSRYGARGWDLVPHGDAIRDIPYYAKDFGRKVVGTFQGSGDRGGYSAV